MKKENNLLSFKEFSGLKKNNKPTKRTEIGGDVLNEKIDWSKKPWIWLKNIMKLEEPEYDEDNEENDEPQPVDPRMVTTRYKSKSDDIVTMNFDLSLSVLRAGSPERTMEAIGKLANVCNLEWSVRNVGRHYTIECKGKRKHCDIFYNRLENAIR